MFLNVYVNNVYVGCYYMEERPQFRSQLDHISPLVPEQDRQSAKGHTG